MRRDQLMIEQEKKLKLKLLSVCSSIDVLRLSHDIIGKKRLRQTTLKIIHTASILFVKHSSWSFFKLLLKRRSMAKGRIF